MNTEKFLSEVKLGYYSIALEEVIDTHPEIYDSHVNLSKRWIDREINRVTYQAGLVELVNEVLEKIQYEPIDFISPYKKFEQFVSDDIAIQLHNYVSVCLNDHTYDVDGQIYLEIKSRFMLNFDVPETKNILSNPDIAFIIFDQDVVKEMLKVAPTKTPLEDKLTSINNAEKYFCERTNQWKPYWVYNSKLGWTNHAKVNDLKKYIIY